MSDEAAVTCDQDQAPVYIPDGYTRPGYFAAVPGIHGPVRFEFRPFTYEQNVKMYQGFTALDPDKQIDRVSRALAKQIVSWDVKNPKGGQPIPCNQPASYRRAAPSFVRRLLDVVSGADGGDPDPKAPEGESPSSDDLGFLEESDEKN